MASPLIKNGVSIPAGPVGLSWWGKTDISCALPTLEYDYGSDTLASDSDPGDQGKRKNNNKCVSGISYEPTIGRKNTAQISQTEMAGEGAEREREREFTMKIGKTSSVQGFDSL